MCELGTSSLVATTPIALCSDSESDSGVSPTTLDNSGMAEKTETATNKTREEQRQQPAATQQQRQESSNGKEDKANRQEPSSNYGSKARHQSPGAATPVPLQVSEQRGSRAGSPDPEYVRAGEAESNDRG